MMRLTTLRMQLRFLVPLGITILAGAYLALPVMDGLTLRWFARDLSLRGSLVANAMSDSLEEALTASARARSRPRCSAAQPRPSHPGPTLGCGSTAAACT